jgi:hypothetical protein
MSASEALSNKQFYTEQNIIGQGNMDGLAARVRGIQNLTSNVYRPAFSHDYTAEHRQPSGTEPGEEEEEA